MSEHLSFARLVEISEAAAGTDSGEARHLETCTRCADEFARARALLGSLYIVGAPAPSPELMARTWTRMVKEHEAIGASTTPQGILDAIRDVFARLVADSLRPALAVRGSGSSTAVPRLLVYETVEYTVSVSMAASGGKTPNRFDLTGTVMPKDAPLLPSGGRVSVVDSEVTASPLAEFGEFRLPATAIGDATFLLVEFPDLRIRVGPLPRTAEDDPTPR